MVMRGDMIRVWAEILPFVIALRHLLEEGTSELSALTADLTGVLVIDPMIHSVALSDIFGLSYHSLNYGLPLTLLNQRDTIKMALH